jgi:hypothetical protein
MLACAGVLIGPASAIAQDSAAEVPDVARSQAQPATTGSSHGIATASGTPRLWATVNICDTAASPDSMGIRAGMPERHSPWVYAGPARYERRQAGWTFQFAPPPPA